MGIEVNQAESQAETDFEPNLTSMVQSGCDLTLSVGFLLADATRAVAEANPAPERSESDRPRGGGGGRDRGRGPRRDR